MVGDKNSEGNKSESAEWFSLFGVVNVIWDFVVKKLGLWYFPLITAAILLLYLVSGNHPDVKDIMFIMVVGLLGMPFFHLAAWIAMMSGAYFSARLFDFINRNLLLGLLKPHRVVDRAIFFLFDLSFTLIVGYAILGGVYSTETNIPFIP